MWTGFYEAGGWGMYPTSLFGFLLVAAGVLVMLRPDRRYVPLLASLTVVTLCAGMLGATMGIVRSFLYLRQVPVADQVTVAALGCAESLHNVVLAFILVIITGLLASIAAVRAARAATGPKPRAAD